DYEVDSKQQAIAFSRSTIVRLKSTVGWGDVPSPKAVGMAERVESFIVDQEGLSKSYGRETLAEVSAQGYLGAYPRLTGFSSSGRPGENLESILREGRMARSHLRELTFERLIDRQRAEIYAYRARIRDNPDTLSFLHPIVIEAVRVWMV